MEHPQTSRRLASSFALTICSGRGGNRRVMSISLGMTARAEEADYNPTKAAQIIAYFALKSAGRAIEVLKAVKLVYLGDRESIGRWGEPILDEPRFSMPHGPVNSFTYEHIKGERKDPDGWSRFLEDRRDNTLRVKDGVTVETLDELSEADIEACDEVWSRFGRMNQWQIRDWTHRAGNVAEWSDPAGSATPIPLGCIMHAVGVEGADGHLTQIDDRRGVDAMLRSMA